MAIHPYMPSPYTSIVMESHAMVKYLKRLRGGWG
jgi:hypothetical protein